MNRVLPCLLTAALLTLPQAFAHADTNAGGGELVGTVSYGPPWVPPTNTGCHTTSFTVSLDSPGNVALVFNDRKEHYEGPVSATGSGQSPCENAYAGGGTVSLDLTGDGLTGGVLRCLGLTGRFARVATDMQLSLTGTCQVGSLVTTAITFFARAEVVPADMGAGLTRPVREETFAGAFVISPA